MSEDSNSDSIELALSRDDAYQIIRAYDDKCAGLVSLSHWGSLNLSSQISDNFNLRTETYAAVFTRVTSSESSGSQIKILITIGSTHALDTISSLHKLMSNDIGQERIPLPALLNRDDSKGIIASPYALHTHPPGEPFNSLYSPCFPSSHALSASSAQEEKDEDYASRTRACLRAELRLGSIFKTVHSVQNDWFGLPGNAKEWEECYSWQVCFTQLLEEALHRLEELERSLPTHPPSVCLEPESSPANSEARERERIPVEDIHRLLARAISFFLFDDVEVPSLILIPSFAWSEHIFVDPSEGEITGLLSFLIPGGSIWGDPTLEGVFHPQPPSSGSISTKVRAELEEEWPSKTFYEAYRNPFPFPRQRTKRLWYDLYVRLLRLARILSLESNDSKREERANNGCGAKGEGRDAEEREQGKGERGREERIRIREIVRRLENAPCY